MKRPHDARRQQDAHEMLRFLVDTVDEEDAILRARRAGNPTQRGRGRALTPAICCSCGCCGRRRRCRYRCEGCACICQGLRRRCGGLLCTKICALLCQLLCTSSAPVLSGPACACVRGCLSRRVATRRRLCGCSGNAGRGGGEIGAACANIKGGQAGGSCDNCQGAGARCCGVPHSYGDARTQMVAEQRGNSIASKVFGGSILSAVRCAVCAHTTTKVHARRACSVR